MEYVCVFSVLQENRPYQMYIFFINIDVYRIYHKCILSL